MQGTFRTPLSEAWQKPPFLVHHQTSSAQGVSQPERRVPKPVPKSMFHILTPATSFVTIRATSFYADWLRPCFNSRPNPGTAAGRPDNGWLRAAFHGHCQREQ